MKWLLLLPPLVLAACDRGGDDRLALPEEGAVNPVLVLQTSEASAQAPMLGYDGSVFFSHGNNIRMLQPNGRHQFWAWVAGARGHRVIPDGRHLVASQDRRVVYFLDEFGRRKTSVQPRGDVPRWASIMDLAFDQWTGFYVSDAGVPEGDGVRPETGAIYYVTPDRQIRLITGKLSAPTGMALSPDWRHLYVLEVGRNRISRFPVEAQGRLGPMSVFAELPVGQSEAPKLFAGGLCFDVQGNLYVASAALDSVLVYDSQGTIVRRYTVGHHPSSVTFGGPNMDQLFVTVNNPGALFRLNLGVRGVDVRPRR